MSFSLDTWKTRLHESLPGWQQRMQQAGVGSIYAFLSAATVWPIVEAMQQGDWAAMSALGGVVAGLGSNLLANSIQDWRDEAYGAQKLAGQIEDDAALRAEIDAVLEELHTLDEARTTLPGVERDWFAETLQQELEKLGNLPRFEVTLYGGDYAEGDINKRERGIHIDGGKVEFHGPAVGGDVGELVMGNKTVHNNVITEQYHYYAADDAHRKRVEQATIRYLKKLRQRCNVLPIGPLGGDESATEEVGLDEVYVALDTRTLVSPSGVEQPDSKELVEQEASIFQPDRDEKRPLAALEAVINAKKLVLLGDPGGGKSSFVRQLCGWLAAAQLGLKDPPEDWQPVIPLFVTLRELGRRLKDIDLDQLSHEEGQKALRDAVWQQWQHDIRDMHAADMLDALPDWLDGGQLLLVFDGLDEIPVANRIKARLAIQAITVDYKDIAHTIVTCRDRSYAGELVLPDFSAHTLASFDKDKIRQFVGAWYQAQVRLERIGAKEAQTLTEELQDAATEDDLMELAANPMLLTTMAIIHQGAVGLPRERVRLYSRAVDVLLRRWQVRKGPLPDDVVDILNNDSLLRQMLEHLAYQAHLQQSRDGEADLLHDQVLALLQNPEYLGESGLASAFLEYVDQRSGLLVGQGGEGHGGKPLTYAFPHRTFQEYLAGCFMVSGRGAARTYWQHVKEGDYWYLAAQLGAEELFYNLRRPHECLDLAYALAPNSAIETEEAWRALIWSATICHLVGQQQVEQDQQPGGGAPFWRRLRDKLPQALRTSELPSRERVEAGRLLARIGDPRAEVIDVDAMQFCYVPAGSFLMGSPDDDSAADNDEKPLHEVTLDYDYWIGRFPVTQTHFAGFMADKGYADRDYWPEAIDAKYWEAGRFKGRWESEWRAEPISYGDPFDLGNHPVVGISWFEALAFCRWLTRRWQDLGHLPEMWRAALPSEAEWEKAARGGTYLPQPAVVRQNGLWEIDSPIFEQTPTAQRYPWGADISAQHANYSAAGIGSSSAVGCFPAGQSPYGCEELSGNVYEWTRSQWGADYPYVPRDGRETLDGKSNRALRGGSYYDNKNGMRCAYRYRSYPGNGDGDYGFRVVLSPFISDL